jgi:hypothetical protein
VPEQYQLIALVPMGYPADAFKRPMRKIGVAEDS